MTNFTEINFYQRGKFRTVNYGRINLKVLISTEYGAFKWANRCFI